MSNEFNIIKTLREAKEYSQENLANLLGITRQTLGKYEKDMSNLPSELVKKLSGAFEVDYQYFIENRMPVEFSYNIINADKQQEVPNMRIDIPAENIDKFKQVLLYILDKVGAKPNVGKTVLYKLLYFIDFDYYELYETQLMGLKYQKNTFGPTPIYFDTLISDMQKNEDLELIKSKYYNKNMTKYLPIKQADLTLFNAQEIKHIDAIIEKLSDKNATELSSLSHKDIPWIIAQDKEILEYESVFYRTPETSVRAYIDNG